MQRIIGEAQALAEFQGQWAGSGSSLSGGGCADFWGATGAGRVANMQGFVASYFHQREDLEHSQKIMYYFKQATCRADSAGAGVCRV